MFDTLEADIVIMQETKIQRKDLRDDMVLIPGWDVYFSFPRHKKGYSGVAIFVRTSKCCPIRAEEGLTGHLTLPNSTTRFCDLPCEEQIGGYPKPGQLTSAIDDLTLDSEGRCVILEFPAFVLLGIYSPAKTTPPKTSSSFGVATNQDGNHYEIEELTRSDFRHAFMELLDTRVRNLVAAGKQVIVAGDLNVSRATIDSAGIVESLAKIDAGVEDWLEEPTRRIFNQLLFNGEVVGNRDSGRDEPVMWDLCRDFHPCRESMYTCWDVRRNLRPANFGSRIDYILCSAGIREWFIEADIQEGLMGSDHCPVYGVLSDRVAAGDLLDLMNPQGMVLKGERLREWVPKDALTLSARLIPEFDRRRNIRDMFMRASSVNPKASTALASPMESQTSTSTASSTQPHMSTAVVSGAAAHTCTTPATASVKRPRAESPAPPDLLTHHTRARASIDPRNPTLADTTKTKPSKKIKATKIKPGPTQSTIKGFFRAIANERPQASTSRDDDVSRSEQGLCRNSSLVRQTKDNIKSDPERSIADYVDQESGLVSDPIENKEAWSRLLGSRVVPKCEHGEPCSSLLTKKPGVNCGRSFYICSRPLGPSGEKEKGTEWRCRTFIWSSDWNHSSQ